MSKKTSRKGSNRVRNQSQSSRTSKSKLYQPRRCKAGTPAIVKTYLHKIGLTNSFPDEADYEQRLLECFGFAAAKFLEAAHNAHGDHENVHALMSASLDLAIAVRSHFYGNRYEEYLAWLASTKLPQPRTVLDSGCDVDVQTCFYAMLFPQATITGVDRCPEAIACAQQLAERLQLKNVRFVTGDVLDLPQDVRNQSFDLVFSTFIASYLADAVGLHPVRCVEEVDLQEPDRGMAAYAGVLAGLLRDDGLLVSFERNICSIHLARWLRVLRDAGICVPAEKIEVLEFFETAYHFSPSFPVLIGSKRTGMHANAEDIRGLWTQGLRQHADLDYQEDDMAESVFVASEPKSFVCGFRHQQHGSDLDYYTELWESDRHMLIYDYRIGGCSLLRGPIEGMAEMIEFVRSELTDNPDICICDEYMSPEDACSSDKALAVAF